MAKWPYGQLALQQNWPQQRCLRQKFLEPFLRAEPVSFFSSFFLSKANFKKISLLIDAKVIIIVTLGKKRLGEGQKGP